MGQGVELERISSSKLQALTLAQGRARPKNVVTVASPCKTEKPTSDKYEIIKFSIASCLAFCVLLLAARVIGVSSAWFSAADQLAIFVSLAVFALCLGLLLAKMHTTGPDRLSFSTRGVELYRSIANFDLVQLIEWQRVERIDILQEEGRGSNRSLVLWARNARLERERYSFPITSFEPKAWCTVAEGLHKYLPESSIGEGLRKEYERLFTKPVEEIKQIGELLLEHKPISYTEVWFQSLHGAKPRLSNDDLKTGTMLNGERFEIRGKLGSGGQGSVYLALERGLKCVSGNERLVALKEFILPEHAGHNAVQRMLGDIQREAQLMDKLRHNGIVKLLDTFIQDWRAYFVLERLDGETLRSLVDRTGSLPETASITFAMKMCEILTFLHSMVPPIVHRDFTPENLMLCQRSTIKLIDFNVALQNEINTGKTVVGKRAFIPLEQFRGEPSAQSDLYALGGTIHFLLTGLDPVPLQQSHPAAANPTISEDLDSIVAKATALNLSDRYKDAQEILRDLQAICDRFKDVREQ